MAKRWGAWAIALGWGLAARATVPVDTYPECGEDDSFDGCPSELDEGDWYLLSTIPEHARDSVREAELELGSGLHADRAWRTTTGRFDVVLAFVDSGIEWENEDLVRKVLLNTGELPLPEAADGSTYPDYDANGDSVVNIDDWAEDPRVDWDAGRDEADGMLDPSDLIATFSDGVDDDGNGWTDDIAGWDFFGRDNDPGHDLRSHFGNHGSGVMEEAAAEAENGGDVGVCPNCAILPVRVGDTFITDGTRAGEAIAFAADHGAVGITLAIGAMSNPELAVDAVRYAWDKGVVIAGAAGDENSYHHNFPAVLDNIVFTHSIRFDTADDDGAVYSYMNTWNCNNFGARLVTVAPSTACATGAVANTVGTIGLIRSAARDAGVDLTAGEVYQLLVGTSDDVWLSDEERAISGAYPSEEGWDPFFGYGRINAERAVEAVVAGDIPPTVTLDSPRWFQTLDPEAVPTVSLEGAVSAERSDGFTWTVELGTGHDPRSWTEVGSGEGSGTYEGVLAELDLAELEAAALDEAPWDEGIVGRLERVNAPAVTVRVRVTDAEGRTGEMRRTFFVRHDDDLLDGFPVDLGGSGESSPVLADLDGDGVYEIVVGTASGEVLALRGDGTALDGWPVSTDPLADDHLDAAPWSEGGLPAPPDGIMATVAVGDLDGDGSPEVVAATQFGGLYAWHADGTLVDGFPTWTVGREPDEFDDDHAYDQGYAAAPTLVDIDGNGTLEIVTLGLDSRMYVTDASGADWGPYPVEICHPELCGLVGKRIIDSASVGDIDGDGELEAVFGTNEAVDDESASVTYAVDLLTGTDEPGWPRSDRGLVNEAVLLPLLGEGHPASPALVDLDGDGDLEIFNPIMLGNTDPIHHDGSEALALDWFADGYGADSNVDASLAPMIIQFVTNPAVGDLDGDGTPDLVLGGASSIYVAALAMSMAKDYQQAVGAWSGADGAMLPGWPRQVEDLQFLLAPAVADITGDGRPEAIYGSAGYLMHAWDADGVEAEGWPKFTGNWIMGSPAVGDIDGDGYLDVVTTTREGWLFAWRTRGPADVAPEWASMFHDPRNTGNYETPLAAQAGPPAEGDEPGGCCRNRSKGDTAAFVVLPLLVGLGRRRRRA